MGESFWQNNSLVTDILFELQPIIIFSPVANLGDQSLPKPGLTSSNVEGGGAQSAPCD